MKQMLKTKERGSLADLRKGQIAKVISMQSDNPSLRRRMLDMGITRGVVLEVKKIAPFGDPIDLWLRGYELCVRRKDVEGIEVEVIA